MTSVLRGRGGERALGCDRGLESRRELLLTEGIGEQSRAAHCAGEFRGALVWFGPMTLRVPITGCYPSRGAAGAGRALLRGVRRTVQGGGVELVARRPRSTL
jgi:hypothetical protein